MLNRISYLTYGAAFTAAAGVLTYYYDHPVTSAINAAVTVVAGLSAFREIAKSITNKIDAATTTIQDKIAGEVDEGFHTFRTIAMPIIIERIVEGGLAERPAAESGEDPPLRGLTPTG
jgi:hypothetical protein